MRTFTIALENALLCPTATYFFLLLPTSSHFGPHHRLDFAVVKGNHAVFQK